MNDIQVYRYYDGRDNYMDTNRGKSDLKAILKEIDDERTLSETPRILEIGCGSGMAMGILKEMWLSRGHKKPLNIRGIDINPFAVKMAKGRGENVKVGDALNLPFKRDKFDVVFGLYVIQEVEPIELINEALRVSKRVVLIYDSGIKIRSLFREIKDESHKIVKLYDYLEYGNKKQVIMATIRKTKGLKAKAEIKSKEDEKDGININRNDTRASS